MEPLYPSEPVDIIKQFNIHLKEPLEEAGAYLLDVEVNRFIGQIYMSWLK